MMSKHSWLYRCGALMVGAWLLLLPSVITAIPYPGIPFTFKQPDGTPVTVMVTGDEFHRGYESADGYTLIREPSTGWWCYAVVSSDGKHLVSTGSHYTSVAGGGLPKTGLAKHVNVGDDIISAARAQTLPRPSSGLARLASPEYALPSTVGVRRAGSVVGLTIVVDFSDEPSTHTVNEVRAIMNEKGYSVNGNNGSVRDFYYDVSNGALDFTNICAGTFRASKPKSYYNARCYDPVTNPDPNAPDFGIRARELVNEALNWLNNPSGQNFNFAQLSNDNGTILAINLYYAGDAQGDEGLWPHQWWTLPFTADGVSAGAYAIQNMGATLTIGTFCHENGHMVMDWPDAYDYTYKSQGLGYFCLMAAGSWNNSQRNPAPPNPFLRYSAGWGTQTDITYHENNTVLTTQSNANSWYVYTNENSAPARESYLIESRTATGRSQHLPDHGLLIWHADLDGSRDNRQHTCGQHYVFSVVQADGSYHLENNSNCGGDGDCFHAGGINSFTGTTTTNSNWWCPTVDGTNSSSLSITNISAAGDQMTFTFCGAQDLAVTHPAAINCTYAQPVTVTTNLSGVRVNLYSAELGISMSQTVSSGSVTFTVIPNNRTGRIYVTVTGKGRRYHGFIDTYNPGAITIVRSGTTLSFPTIVAAIKAVRSNETINVTAGDYRVEEYADVAAGVSNVTLKLAANARVRIIGTGDGISVGKDGFIIGQPNTTVTPHIEVYNTSRAGDIPAPAVSGAPVPGSYPYSLFANLCTALQHCSSQQTVSVGPGLYTFSGISDVGLVGVLTNDRATSSVVRMGFSNTPECTAGSTTTGSVRTVVRSVWFELNEDQWGTVPVMTVYGSDVNVFDHCIFANTTAQGGIPTVKQTGCFALGTADLPLTGSVEFSNCTFRDFHVPVTVYTPMTNAQSPVLTNNIFINNDIDIQFREGSQAVCGLRKSNISSAMVGSVIYRGAAAINQLIAASGCPSAPGNVSVPSGVAVDPWAYDNRISSSSDLIDAGYQAIGALPYRTVYRFQAFADAEINFSNGGKIALTSGVMTTNTFGANAVVERIVTPDLYVVNQIAVTADVRSLSSVIRVKVPNASLIPANLPANLPVWEASINGTGFGTLAYRDLNLSGVWVERTVKPDNTAPARVSPAVTATGGDNYITWQPVSDTDLLRYKIYRCSSSPNTLPVQIASCDKWVTAFTDAQNTAPARSYAVVSYDKTGNESEPVYPVYVENFNYSPLEGSVTDPAGRWGFGNVAYWYVPREDQGTARPDASTFLRTNAPGDWSALAECATPVFYRKISRQNFPVVMNWKVRVPTAYGPSWRENNKLWVSLCNAQGVALYSLLFKPNRPQDAYTSFDLQLTKDNSAVLAEATTHVVTPNGSGAPWLQFKLVLYPNGVITVWYDANDGRGFVEYICTRDESYREFSRASFRYKTGTGLGNYFIDVDEIRVSNAAFDNGAVEPKDVSPVLESIRANADNTCTAYFGYYNPNSCTVTLPLGPYNKFTGGSAANLGQPVQFLPGRYRSVFSVTWSGTSCLVWSLNYHTSTAGGCH